MARLFSFGCWNIIKKNLINHDVQLKYVPPKTKLKGRAALM